MKLESPITEVKGIGSQTAKRMHRIGVYTAGDILLHYPREYVRFKEPIKPSDLKEEGHAAVIGRILRAPALKRSSRMELVQTIAGDLSGTIELVWFRMPYMKSKVRLGEIYVFYGRVRKKGRQYGMEQPQVYTMEQYQEKMKTLQPVYTTTEGLSGNKIAKAVRAVLEELPLSYDTLPDSIRRKEGLCDYHAALCQAHFPEQMEQLEAARKRLAFEEFFFFLLQIQLSKAQRQTIANDFPLENETVLPYVLSHLPYELTRAQKNCLDEIVTDLKKKDCHAASYPGRRRLRQNDRRLSLHGFDGGKRPSVRAYGADGGVGQTALRHVYRHVPFLFAGAHRHFADRLSFGKREAGSVRGHAKPPRRDGDRNAGADSGKSRFFESGPCDYG